MTRWLPELVAGAVAAGCLGACAAAPGPALSPATSRPRAAAAPVAPLAGEPQDQELRALLLLLADRRLFEPFTVERAFAGDAVLRRDLAVSLGRVGSARGRPTLEALLLDPEPEVRRAATFALGEVGDQAARPALLRLAGGPDRETGVLAVEALGKLAAPVLEVAQALLALPEAELLPRLLPSLFRFPRDADRLELARAGLARAADPFLFARAAYALAREPLPEAAPDLERLLTHGDPWVRGWAARGLGEVGGTTSPSRLRPLLDDPAPGPTIQALRAAARLAHEGKAMADAAWKPPLLALLDDERPAVRATAVEAAAAWLPDPELASRLAALAEQPETWSGQLALEALARGGDPAAAPRVRRAAAAADPALRARAAAAAGTLGAEDLLAVLAADPSPSVRLAALAARLDAGPSGNAAAAPAVTAALEDPDPAVRALALEWLREHPILPLAAIARAIGGPNAERLPDPQLAGAAALGARAAAEPPERDAIAALLAELAGAAEPLLRRAAARELEKLGGARVDAGAAGPEKPLEVYRQVLQRTAVPRRVELVTSRGRLLLELDCPRAPLTCLSFLQLAAQGFFDGLSFHRVVPDFVVQGGDPRGDGWGGPGYTLRDEIDRLPFRRGTLGMALAGPDTGGSQFFLCLSDQPHLDGGFAAFGRVVAGEELLDAIERGDRIERIRELP